MKKKQILQEIKNVLTKNGFSYEVEGYVIRLGLTKNSNSNISVTFRIEIFDKETFEVLCFMPNLNNMALDKISNYVYSHKTKYFRAGVTDDFQTVLLVKYMTPACIDTIGDVIVDTLMEVFPYVTGV